MTIFCQQFTQQICAPVQRVRHLEPSYIFCPVETLAETNFHFLILTSVSEAYFTIRSRKKVAAHIKLSSLEECHVCPTVYVLKFSVVFLHHRRRRSVKKQSPEFGHLKHQNFKVDSSFDTLHTLKKIMPTCALEMPILFSNTVHSTTSLHPGVVRLPVYLKWKYHHKFDLFLLSPLSLSWFSCDRLLNFVRLLPPSPNCADALTGKTCWFLNCSLSVCEDCSLQ